MKKVGLLTLVAAFLIPNFSMASDERYLNEEKIVTDLKKLVGWCDEMVDGQVRTEVYGLLFVKNGTRCHFTNGEVEEHVRSYLHNNPVDWAGIEGEHGLWVVDSSDE